MPAHIMLSAASLVVMSFSSHQIQMLNSSNDFYYIPTQCIFFCHEFSSSFCRQKNCWGLNTLWQSSFFAYWWLRTFILVRFLSILVFYSYICEVSIALFVVSMDLIVYFFGEMVKHITKNRLCLTSSLKVIVFKDLCFAMFCQLCHILFMDVFRMHNTHS